MTQAMMMKDEGKDIREVKEQTKTRPLVQCERERERKRGALFSEWFKDVFIQTRTFPCFFESTVRQRSESKYWPVSGCQDAKYDEKTLFHDLNHF